MPVEMSETELLEEVLATPERSPDVFFIGYPKAGSTFIHQYLKLHPGLFVDYRAAGFINRASPVPLDPAARAAMAAAKTYVSQNEKLSLSVLPKAPIPKKGFMFDPDMGEQLDDVFEYSPIGVAQKIMQRCPDTRILICIKEQTAWLDSSYRYFLDRMPPGKRTFSDFLKTPRGRLMLRIGHHDEVIEAYTRVFGPDRVKVLRLEWLKDRPEYFVSQLCGFLEIDTRCQLPEPANVGRTVPVTLVRRFDLPIHRLPEPVKIAGRKLLNALPRRMFIESILTTSDRERLTASYAASNRRTSDMIDPDMHA